MPENNTKAIVEFLEPFVKGAIHTLKVQCSMETKPGKPFYRGQVGTPDVHIIGGITITSKSFNGVISICFPERVFLDLMGTMLGQKFVSISVEIQDGASELMNIIFGQAKMVLNERGHSIQKAIPHVKIGNEIIVTTVSGKSIIVPFDSPSGQFYIEILWEDLV